MESQRRSFLTAAVATALTISAVGFAIVDGVSSYEAPVVADLTPGWDLVWEDEFEGSSLDTTRWNVPVGDGCPELCGWGRGELQYFLDESVSVEGGELVLTADDRFYEHWPFTSGRLRASYAGEWPSGRIEARISAPEGDGLRSTFSIVPSDAGVASRHEEGRIDVMEVVGYREKEVLGTLHGGYSSSDEESLRGVVTQGSSVTDHYRDYAVEWDEYSIRWYLDDRMYHEVADWQTDRRPFPAPVGRDFDLVVSLAVGGDDIASPTASSLFPKRLKIDRVRVFRRSSQSPAFRVLAFTRTAGHRHESIETAVDTIRALGKSHGFAVDVTEDAAAFNDESLSRYDAVVFVNTTDEHGQGVVLDEGQQEAFKRFIQSGKGYAGLHSASDTEYDWPWYGSLVGAYFVNHPHEQRARIRVLDRSHPSTAHLPEVWEMFEEWYNFDSDPTGRVRVLAELDETSYEGGTMGRHPIAWCQEYDGGRSWYTGIGHRPDVFADPLVQEHLYGGIAWAAGAVPGDCSLPAE